MVGHSSVSERGARDQQNSRFPIPESEREATLIFGPPRIGPALLQEGRPVTRRPVAVRALQLQIDTGQTWSAIAQQI